MKASFFFLMVFAVLPLLFAADAVVLPAAKPQVSQKSLEKFRKEEDNAAFLDWCDKYESYIKELSRWYANKEKKSVKIRPHEEQRYLKRFDETRDNCYKEAAVLLKKIDEEIGKIVSSNRGKNMNRPQFAKTPWGDGIINITPREQKEWQETRRKCIFSILMSLDESVDGRLKEHLDAKKPKAPKPTPATPPDDPGKPGKKSRKSGK